jgi:hypothetical protein
MLLINARHEDNLPVSKMLQYSQRRLPELEYKYCNAEIRTDFPDPVSPVITAKRGAEPRVRTECSNRPQFCNSKHSTKESEHPMLLAEETAQWRND